MFFIKKEVFFAFIDGKSRFYKAKSSNYFLEFIKVY